jgi:cellobiose-specific phosphotransferase system component IIC
MEITFNTPALLFPAISLLLLAYTNRFLALANLVRKLHDEYQQGTENKIILNQIHSLRYRLRLVRYMQTLGVFSFVCSVFCMYSIYAEWTVASRYIFAVSLLSLLISLVISLVEITQSTKALELELSDIEEPGKKNFFTEFLSGATEKKD